MPFDRICPVCSIPFVTTVRRVLHCSVRCGNISKTVQTPEAIRAYLLAHVTLPDDPDTCWPWHGSINDKGYAVACVRTTRIAAHRVSYEVFVGLIPKNAHILHAQHCTAKTCINPRHLRPGTNQENVHDRLATNQQIRGSQHYRSRLQESDVLAILAMFHDEKLSISTIAQRVERHVVTIHDIIHRVTWKHVAPNLYPMPAHDQRMHRHATHTLSETAKEELAHLRMTQGISFTQLGKQFGISMTQAWRVYRRFLQKTDQQSDTVPQENHSRQAQRKRNNASQWAKKHPTIHSNTAGRARARHYNANINDLAHAQWVAILETFEHRCVYCGKKAKGKLTQDHITPLSQGGNHTAQNVVPACQSCNSTKQGKHTPIPIQPLLLI